MFKFNSRILTIFLAAFAALAGLISELTLLFHSPLYRTRNIMLLCLFSLLLLACISTFFYEVKHRRHLAITEHILEFERLMYSSALMAECDYAYTVNVTENKIHVMNEIGYLKDYGFDPTLPFDSAMQITHELMHPTMLIGTQEVYYTKDLQAAFNAGKRLLEAVYYIPDADLYKKKTVFLSRDEKTQTVYAFVVSHDVSNEQRAAARTRQALRVLTNAAEEIASGNMDVQIDCSADGDVGILAQSFRHTVEHLKSYISNINTLASTDSMTATKNRTAYLARITELDLQLVKGTPPRFAVVMFDLNNLKYINDTFGHSEGDKSIVATAKRLRQYFPRAELFRFGGDEFVALLLDVTPTEIDEMILAFEESLMRRNKRQSVKLSIACGYAFYNKAFDTCFADVYARADAAMYSQKRKLKGRANTQ